MLELEVQVTGREGDFTESCQDMAIFQQKTRYSDGVLPHFLHCLSHTVILLSLVTDRSNSFAYWGYVLLLILFTCDSVYLLLFVVIVVVVFFCWP